MPHHVAMQRHMNAELHLDEKPVERSVDQGVRLRIDGPDAASRFLSERDASQRRRQFMVLGGDPYRLAEIRAGENRKSKETKSRHMDSQPGAIGEEGIIRALHRLAADPKDLVDRNPGLRRRQRCGRELDGSKRLTERNAVLGQRGDERRELADRVDLFVGTSPGHARTSSLAGKADRRRVARARRSRVTAY